MVSDDSKQDAALVAGAIEEVDKLLRKVSGGGMSLIIYSTRKRDMGYFAWVNRTAQLDVKKHQELARAAQGYIDWVATLKADELEHTDEHP